MLLLAENKIFNINFAFLLFSKKIEYSNGNVWKKELSSELEYNKRLLTLILDVDKLMEHLTAINYVTVQKKEQITRFHMKYMRTKQFLNFLMNVQPNDMLIIAAALRHCQQMYASNIIIQIQNILLKLVKIDEVCSTSFFSNFSTAVPVKTSNCTINDNSATVNLFDYCNLSNFQHREITQIVDFGSIAVVYVDQSSNKSKYQV